MISGYRCIIVKHGGRHANKDSVILKAFWIFLKLSEDEDWPLLRMFVRLWYIFFIFKADIPKVKSYLAWLA